MELYCIEHEEMVDAENFATNDGTFFGHTHIIVDYDSGILISEDLDFCEMVEGWATVPPPEFDMDEWLDNALKQFGVDYQTIEDDFLAYDYDVETDQIITEVFP